MMVFATRSHVSSHPVQEIVKKVPFNSPMLSIDIVHILTMINFSNFILNCRFFFFFFFVLIVISKSRV